MSNFNRWNVQWTEKAGRLAVNLDNEPNEAGGPQDTHAFPYVCDGSLSESHTLEHPDTVYSIGVYAESADHAWALVKKWAFRG